METDFRTGLITLQVVWDRNWLAAGVTNAMIDSLDRYIRLKSNAKARENRLFVESQMQGAYDSLLTAEARLTTFREQNRRIEHSPELLEERERLDRDKRIQEENYLVLRKEYALAKIEEVQNTSIVNILDRAIVPMDRTSPKRTLIVLAMAFLGTLLGGVMVWAQVYRHGPPGPSPPAVLRSGVAAGAAVPARERA